MKCVLGHDLHNPLLKQLCGFGNVSQIIMERIRYHRGLYIKLLLLPLPWKNKHWVGSVLTEPSLNVLPCFSLFCCREQIAS